MKGYLYILKSNRTNKYYIGSTGNINRRLVEHNSGQTKSTRGGVPWTLMFIQEYSTLGESKRVELRLKKLKRKDYLEGIIRDGVVKLSK